MSYLVGSSGLSGGIFGPKHWHRGAGDTSGRAGYASSGAPAAADLVASAASLPDGAPQPLLPPPAAVASAAMAAALPASVAAPTQTDGSPSPKSTVTTMDAGGKGPPAVEVHADTVSVTAPAVVTAAAVAASVPAPAPQAQGSNALYWAAAALGAYWLYSRSSKKSPTPGA